MTHKIAVKILLLITILGLQSCHEDDCGACFTPPNPFLFELVTKDTGENLFSNGTFNPNEIEIINLADDSSVDFTFLDENNINLIRINTIGWETEIINYTIYVGNENIFDLYVDAERLLENCCSFTKYHEIRIENASFQFDTTTDIYKILL